VGMWWMWWISQAESEAAHTATHAGIFKNSHLDGHSAAVTPLRSSVTAIQVS
jgi:hypothetical protein